MLGSHVRAQKGREALVEAGHFERCPARDLCICSTRTPHNASDRLSRLTAMEAGWRSVARRIVCISLQEKPDRFAAACDEAHRVGLCRILTFYRPTKPTDADMARADALAATQNSTLTTNNSNLTTKLTIQWRGFMGSWEAHRHVQSSCAVVGGGGGRLLVLEDDFRVLPFVDAELLHRVGSHVDSLPAGWEVFYLGHQPAAGYPVRADLSVFRVISCWIHAVVLSDPAQRRIASESYVSHAARLGREETLDGWIMREFRQYAAFPMLVVQSAIGSDNLPSHRRKLFGRNELIEWWTRFHRDHSFAIELSILVILPLVAILLLLLLLTFLANKLTRGKKIEGPIRPTGKK